MAPHSPKINVRNMCSLYRPVFIATIYSGFSTRSTPGPSMPSQCTLQIPFTINLNVSSSLTGHSLHSKSYKIMIVGVLGRFDLGRENQLLAKCNIQRHWNIPRKHPENINFVVVFLTEVLAF